jgi:signal transduction histidine kinase
LDALAACRGRLRAAVAILSRANFALEEAVEARDHAIAELRAADRAQDAFVVAAAHELKTPLTAIKGHGQLLRRQARAGTLDPARLDAGLAAIDAAAGLLAADLDALIAEVGAAPPGADAAPPA